MTDEVTYNPEAGMPVHADNDWHLPELVGRVWTAREVQDALAACGFVPFDYDETLSEPCDCAAPIPGTDVVQAEADCGVCGGAGSHPLQLQRNKRWVRGDQALRVPNDPNSIVSPYLAACCAALLA